MTTLFSALDWRAMNQEARDLGLNNGVAVPGSVDMVAGWEQRSADVRKRFPGHIDMRYGPRERNRIDFLKAGAPRRFSRSSPRGRWRTASMSR
jgi:arylformamidase